jgi:hypothetical protein
VAVRLLFPFLLRLERLVGLFLVLLGLFAPVVSGFLLLRLLLLRLRSGSLVLVFLWFAFVLRFLRLVRLLAWGLLLLRLVFLVRLCFLSLVLGLLALLRLASSVGCRLLVRLLLCLVRFLRVLSPRSAFGLFFVVPPFWGRFGGGLASPRGRFRSVSLFR